jgi:hypothetical protein
VITLKLNTNEARALRAILNNSGVDCEYILGETGSRSVEKLAAESIAMAPEKLASAATAVWENLAKQLGDK